MFEVTLLAINSTQSQPRATNTLKLGLFCSLQFQDNVPLNLPRYEAELEHQDLKSGNNFIVRVHASYTPLAIIK